MLLQGGSRNFRMQNVPSRSCSTSVEFRITPAFAIWKGGPTGRMWNATVEQRCTQGLREEWIDFA